LWCAVGQAAGRGGHQTNPPFGVAEHLRTALPWLANLMDQAPDEEPSEAGWRLETPDEQPSEPPT
jgi:hypothetical protein